MHAYNFKSTRPPQQLHIENSTIKTHQHCLHLKFKSSFRDVHKYTFVTKYQKNKFNNFIKKSASFCGI